MLGLTPLGTIHTAISLIALATGIISLVRYGRIGWNNTVGKTYVVATILTCLTAFGLFQHGFGKGHVLGIITLVVLGIAFASGNKTSLFPQSSPYIEAVCYSMTVFFHLSPGIREPATRLPVDAPLAS